MTQLHVALTQVHIDTGVRKSRMWSDQFASSLKDRDDRQKEIFGKIRAALRIGNNESVVQICEKRMLQIDTLTDMLTNAERIGNEQYHRAQTLQMSLLAEMEKVTRLLEERLKRNGIRKK